MLFLLVYVPKDNGTAVVKIFDKLRGKVELIFANVGFVACELTNIFEGNPSYSSIAKDTKRNMRERNISKSNTVFSGILWL